jgi:hypothetical protein
MDLCCFCPLSAKPEVCHGTLLLTTTRSASCCRRTCRGHHHPPPSFTTCQQLLCGGPWRFLLPLSSSLLLFYIPLVLALCSPRLAISARGKSAKEWLLNSYYCHYLSLLCYSTCLPSLSLACRGPCQHGGPCCGCCVEVRESSYLLSSEATATYARLSLDLELT